MTKINFANWAAQMSKQHDDLVAKYGEDYDKPSATFGLNIAESRSSKSSIGTSSMRSIENASTPYFRIALARFVDDPCLASYT